ncbi:hypothetical protein [uncultured Serinicoccus sp.]|uniref:hypothetical protein n=1 Tax=uncultured Serinicoccus sp. TaxID=735514 RepID=UPI00260628BA|nr:hypothetical protein [uncultured Serinicoccus sp.]
MNSDTDLDLLRRHGPPAHELSDHTRHQARSQLMEAISAERQAPAPLSYPSAVQTKVSKVTPLPRRRLRRARRIALVAACAAALTGLITLTPGLIGQPRQAVAIVNAPEVTFPVTVGHVPEGLGEVVYDRDTGFTAARWTVTGATLSVTVADENRFDGTVRERIDIAGAPAEILNLGDGLAVVYELEDDWVAVAGTGALADAAQLERVAESVRPEEHDIDLNLTMAPQGWQPATFKDGVIVTYTPDGTSGLRFDDPSVTVILEDAPLGGLADVESVTIDGRAAQLGRGMEDAHILDGTTEQGTNFRLIAPATFTREQVLELGSGVRD